ncbi:NAD-dependent dihydropyrimidine dehydrogenase subunit PreA [Acidihalobacter ferrooxydans]|uniref:dihydrouracil dehydrogenase (NAD(+)) n=1 Tax=Acidihalobacter ferrooxydans TaxID=1765967 RepID=A0A1P8UGP2_9GAMM|nr:NAD-dependent dihydropyrimidine dehydrogenase subunit PreA [Acidihalobacter ferrooxydans]APZ42934.1 dihydropyrimidine dehydrogenase subunit B [Acidihalobacter ferrooxydans]
MSDLLQAEFAGIRSPNPFWLASAPPTDKAYNVRRAFEAGWGGVVWKTLGEDGPPVVNVNGPRYGYWRGDNGRVMGFNNIELITDRPLDLNLREIAEIKREWPDRAVVVSVMFPMEERPWRELLPRIEDTGADGIELNLGCPHGMSERGMGSAVGQAPELTERVTAWAKAFTRLPVIVKLTPNVTDITLSAAAARRGGADAVSLINTINSIMGVDLDVMAPTPTVDGRGSHGGYCGTSVRPIALHMVAEIARHAETAGLPISGIGGIGQWRDAAEYLALGAGNVQVCTAAMLYGFRIVKDMIDGLEAWMRDKGHTRLTDFVGAATPQLSPWERLNLNYVTKARIDEARCIGCGRCHIACEDTSHQAIGRVEETGRYRVRDADCVGCNLCVAVCPVPDCIDMVQLTTGSDPRTGQPILDTPADWTTHPNNPQRRGACGLG